MKENSIEEDITRIKQRIEDVKEYIKYGLPYSDYLDLENSFDNMLWEEKKTLKENEELKEINNELEAEKNEAIRRYNFETIPIKKVKDKIEELNKAYEDSKDENGESEYYYPDYTIRVLEELLGDK